MSAGVHSVLSPTYSIKYLLKIPCMQRIVPDQILLLGCCLALLTGVYSLPTDEQGLSFIQQRLMRTTNGDVVLEDMDDFSNWLYAINGTNYDSNDDYRVYQVTSGPNFTRDYVVDSDEYNNPSARNYRSFIDITTVDNPMARDLDELPDSPDDKGDEHYQGKLSWVLVTSFTAGQQNTGKIWAVPRDRSDRKDAFVLVGGLQTPTGVCFDSNHNFLYVCDPAQNSIFQYEIDWKGEKKFVLNSDIVATIAQNVTAQDCAVDAHGNLFFADHMADNIVQIEYLNLWAGFLTQGTPLYSEGNFIAAPIGIDVWKSKTIYYINSQDASSVGVLNSAPVDPTGRRITAEVREDRTPLALTVTPNYAYFSLTDGSVSFHSALAVSN